MESVYPKGGFNGVAMGFEGRFGRPLPIGRAMVYKHMSDCGVRTHRHAQLDPDDRAAHRDDPDTYVAYRRDEVVMVGSREDARRALGVSDKRLVWLMSPTAERRGCRTRVVRVPASEVEEGL